MVSTASSLLAEIGSPRLADAKRNTYFAKLVLNLLPISSLGFTNSYQGSSLTDGHSASVGVPKRPYMISSWLSSSEPWKIGFVVYSSRMIHLEIG